MSWIEIQQQLDKQSRDEMVSRALKVFNESLFSETSNTLATYWNPNEYIPAMRAAVSASQPNRDEFHEAVKKVTDSARAWALNFGSAEGTDNEFTQLRDEFNRAVDDIWLLVYGEGGQQ